MSENDNSNDNDNDEASKKLKIHEKLDGLLNDNYHLNYSIIGHSDKLNEVLIKLRNMALPNMPPLVVTQGENARTANEIIFDNFVLNAAKNHDTNTFLVDAVRQSMETVGFVSLLVIC